MSEFHHEELIIVEALKGVDLFTAAAAAAAMTISSPKSQSHGVKSPSVGSISHANTPIIIQAKENLLSSLTVNQQQQKLSSFSSEVTTENTTSENNSSSSVVIDGYHPLEDHFMHNQMESKDRLTHRNRRIYSTTSSVYAEHTVSDPNNDQVLYCIAAVMQAQMFDDMYNDEFSSEGYPEFNLSVILPPEYGGERDTIPQEILDHETLNDNELRDLLLQNALPTVDTIYRFFKYLMVLTDYSIECNILALVYINRTTVKNKIAVTKDNWRGLWLGAIILAQKVWDDKPLKTSSFCSIISSLTRQQVIAAEMKIFEKLDYSTTVRPSVYVKYFFELHDLFREITGTNNNYTWNLQALTMAEKKRLELRSKRHGKELRAKYQKASSSPQTMSVSATIEQTSDSAVIHSAAAARVSSSSSSALPSSSVNRPKTTDDLSESPLKGRYVIN